MIIRRVAISIIAILLFSTVCHSSALHPVPLQNFLAQKYQPITTVDGIPQNIKEALLKRMKHDPRIANPGEKFNKTDLINARYPMRRLVVAGKTDSSCFICYEHGGRGYHLELVIFNTEKEVPKLEFVGRFFAKISSLEQLVEAIRNDLIRDETVEAERYGYY